MDTNDCELLLVLAEEGNITKAAERLYTSQSAISYRIKSLERELNVTLFIRSKQGIIPTRECAPVLEFVKEMKQKYDAMLSRVHTAYHSDEIEGTVRLGATTSIATYALRQLLKSYQERFPNVRIMLSANNSDVIYRMYLEGRLDVALTRGDFEPVPNNRLLYEEPIYVVSKEALSLPDLPEQSFLMHPNSNARAALQEWWMQHFHYDLTQFIEIDNIESCLQMVNQGYGWTMLPALPLVGKKNFSLMQMRWADGTPMLRKTWCYLNLQSEAPHTRSLFDYLLEGLPKALDLCLGNKH